MSASLEELVRAAVRSELNDLRSFVDRRLADRPFVAGADYGIADMACYPWIVPHEKQGQRLADFPYLNRWFEEISARPATVRAYALEGTVNPAGSAIQSEEQRRILFGQGAALPGGAPA